MPLKRIKTRGLFQGLSQQEQYLMKMIINAFLSLTLTKNQNPRTLMKQESLSCLFYEDATYLHKTGMKVIPASLKFEDFDSLSMSNLRRHLLSSSSDIVLVDSAPGINHESLSVLKASDEVIVITNPNMASVSSALKTIRLAQHHGKIITGVLVNRAGFK